MSILNVEHLTHGFGDRAIFGDVSFRLLKGEHIGLVGANGEGKSTFLNIVTGKLQPDEGKIEWAKNVRVGYLDQHTVLEKGMTIRDVLNSAFAFLFDMEADMNKMFEQMGEASPEEMEKLLEETGTIQDLLEQHDFYVIDAKVEEVARALGLMDIGLERDVTDLSGGQRTKVLLAKLLLEKPDILLLDEPTNYLDEEADASEIVGSEYINADKYLQDIVRDKRYWETKRQNIRKREKQMEETIAKYEKEIQELEKSRKEILKKAKSDAEQLIQESNAVIENTIRTIKEAQADKERTRLARQELSEFKEQIDDLDKQSDEDKIARKMERLREKQERKKDKKNQKTANTSTPTTPKVRPIEVGSTVKIKGQTGVGEVLSISGKNAMVMFGMIKTNVKLERLERTDAPVQKTIAKSTFVSSETQDRVYEKKLSFKQDIDVRGMRGDEAIQAVTYFIDDAILLGVSRVRILHGTGNGILRTLIRDYLSGVAGISHFQDEHVQFGGAGITVVDLD